MRRFGEWWRRMMRAGYAFAQGAAMHGRSADRHCVAETRSNWVWGAFIPLIALIAAWPTRGWSLMILLGYLLLGMKVLVEGLRRQVPGRLAATFAIFCVIGKIPQAAGQLQFARSRMNKRLGQSTE